MNLPSAAELLATQVRHAWDNTRRVLDGVTEEEYFWEPAPNAWSVRPRRPGVTGFGRGDFVCEDIWPPPDPVPIPTIAWTFGEARLRLSDIEVPGDRAGGLAWLEAAQERLAAAVDALSDEEVFEYRAAHWGQHLPVAHLISSMISENVHHIAEVGVLRDLHRGHARNQAPPPPTPGRSWWQPRPEPGD